MNKQQYLFEIRGTYDYALEIVEKKSSDYAGDENPFSNFDTSAVISGIPVTQGLLVRIADKQSRLTNLLNNNREAKVLDESIEDTIVDMINYLAILKAHLHRENESSTKEERNN